MRRFLSRSGSVVGSMQNLRHVTATARSDRHPCPLYSKCDTVANLAGLGASKRKPGFNFRGLGELKS